MPFPLLALPVLHSSGAWIAYAGSGYLAGTLSSTPIGAFILGNSTLLAGTGLISAGSLAVASGALAGVGASAAAGLGTALTAVGLGGVASWMGIAPTVTFLGLTPAGWAVAGSAALVAALGTVFTRRFMKRFNEELAKDGRDPMSVRQLINEVRAFEKDAMRQILEDLAKEGADIVLGDEDDEVQIGGIVLSIKKLGYRVNKDGSEEIGYVTRLGRFARVHLVKPADGSDGAEPSPA